MARMYTTKRPLNKCNNCSYTWYPRGKNLSKCCPRCKSRSVGIVRTPPHVTVAMILGCVLVFFWIKSYDWVAEGIKRNQQKGEEGEAELYKKEVGRDREIFKQNQVVVNKAKIEEKKVVVENKEPTLEERLMERARKRIAMEQERIRIEKQRKAEELERIEIEKRKDIAEYTYRIDVKSSISVDKGKKIKVEWLISEICKKADVPYLKDGSRELAPWIKKAKINRFKCKNKSFAYMLKLLASSNRMDYVVTEKGILFMKR